VDGAVSGSCPMAGFGISGVEPWGSATTVLETMANPEYDTDQIACHSHVMSGCTGRTFNFFVGHATTVINSVSRLRM